MHTGAAPGHVPGALPHTTHPGHSRTDTEPKCTKRALALVSVKSSGGLWCLTPEQTWPGGGVFPLTASFQGRYLHQEGKGQVMLLPHLTPQTHATPSSLLQGAFYFLPLLEGSLQRSTLFLYLPQKAFRGEIAQGGDDGGSAVPSFCSDRVSLLQEDCEGRLFTCMFTKNCSKPAPVHMCQHLSGCAQVMDPLQHRAPHLHFPSRMHF